MALRAMWQFMDRDVNHKILYEAKLRSIYYFVGDRPVHKMPFGLKCHELFVILYSILANLSFDMFLVIVYI
jgi:hypothetical protein